MSDAISVTHNARPQAVSIKSFFIIWFGQLISVTGTGLTRFALGIWVYQMTGSATKFALAEVFAALPAILIFPLAGVLIDRHNRRWIMILSDAGSGLSTLMIALILKWGHLELWEIYAVAAIKSICAAFQWPAYSALVTVIVPRQHLARVSGMMQFSEALAQTMAPALAGVLIAVVKIWGVIFIDVASFSFAIIMLGLAVTPPFVPDANVLNPTVSWTSRLLFGWKYIRQRPAFMALLIFFAITNCHHIEHPNGARLRFCSSPRGSTLICGTRHACRQPLDECVGRPQKAHPGGARAGVSAGYGHHFCRIPPLSCACSIYGLLVLFLSAYNPELLAGYLAT
jgi:MFS family permease